MVRNRKESSKSPSGRDVSGYSAVETTLDQTTEPVSTTSNKGNSYSSSKDGTNSPSSKRTSTPSVDNSTSFQSKRIISPSIEISNISVTGTMYQFNNDNERTLTSFMDGSIDNESQTISAKDPNGTLDFTETEDDEDESALNTTRSVFTKNNTIYSNRELSSSSSSSSLFFSNEALKSSTTPPLTLSYVPAAMTTNNNIKASFKKPASNNAILNSSEYSFNNGLVRELSNSMLGGRMSQKSVEVNTHPSLNAPSRRSRTRTQSAMRSSTLPNRMSRPVIQRSNSLSTTKISETNPEPSQTKKINNNFQFKQSCCHQQSEKSAIKSNTGSTKISIPIYDSNANRYLNTNKSHSSRKSTPVVKNSKQKCKKKNATNQNVVQTNPNILNFPLLNAYENNLMMMMIDKKIENVSKNNNTDNVNNAKILNNLYMNAANEANFIYMNGDNNFKPNLYANDNPNIGNIYTNDHHFANNNNLYANDLKHSRAPSSMGTNRTVRRIKRYNSCDVGKLY